MLARELKVTRRSLIIWTSVLIFMYLVVFLIYPHISNSLGTASLSEMLKVMPEEILKAFNMDVIDISTALGWFKTEGNTFLLLIYGLFASISGSSILLKEESDKTIEFLYSKPVKRSSILINKVVAGVINISIMFIIVTVFISGGLILLDCFEANVITLCLTPLIPTIVLYLLSIFISTFFHKTKKTIGISIGLVFLFYFISTFSAVSSNTEFMKYFSIYTLAGIREIVEGNGFNYIYILIGIVLSTILYYGTLLRYKKKELI